MPAVALKYLALFSMLSDHIFKVFGIHSAAMAVFGRLAFPLFCWLSAVGFRKTRSRVNYLIRLFICAIISEIPFDMLWRHAVFDISVQNVCFTLFLGGLSCVLYDEILKLGGRYIVFAFAASAAPIALAGILHTDYGWFGAALLFLLYLSGERKLLTALAVLVFDITLCASRHIGLTGFLYDIQHYCLLALPFILTASGKKWINPARRTGFFARYYFYIFYPLHMALLWLIRALMQNRYIF